MPARHDYIYSSVSHVQHFTPLSFQTSDRLQHIKRTDGQILERFTDSIALYLSLHMDLQTISQPNRTEWLKDEK